MLLGATYSHREIARLKLKSNQSFQQALSLNLDLLRLGLYWDEVEPTPGKYNFKAIESLLKQCQKRQQKVVLSIGMKAPRWPEFFLPQWLKINYPDQAVQQVVAFIYESVKKLQSYDCIAYWQVENEPFDRSGPNKWSIPFQLLRKEVELIRQLDSRPIHINMWGDTITRSPYYAKAAQLADTVGLDIYYHQPTNKDYHGPRFRNWQFDWWRWKQRFKGQFKPLWITELQAEGWEKHDSLKFSATPGSISPASLTSNLKSAAQLKPEVILFWGLEYWLWQKGQGRPQLWDKAEELIKVHRKYRYSKIIKTNCRWQTALYSQNLAVDQRQNSMTNTPSSARIS
jgi:hypothetical protein